MGRGRAGADAGMGRLPLPGGGDPSLPLLSPPVTFRGRRTPPTCSWGVRRPRGGQDARPIRPGRGPGRRQAPRRPHDAGRPIEGPRRHRVPSPAGPRRAALARGRWPISGWTLAARAGRGIGPRLGVPASAAFSDPTRSSATSPARDSAEREIIPFLSSSLAPAPDRETRSGGKANVPFLYSDLRTDCIRPQARPGFSRFGCAFPGGWRGQKGRIDPSKKNQKT